MSFPDKEQRKVCWEARDAFWSCLDDAKIPPGKEASSSECIKLRKLYEKSCPTTWVKHFDRKRTYTAFKARMEKEGFEPLEQK